jgi:PEP-CTERM motif-containing protein
MRLFTLTAFMLALLGQASSARAGIVLFSSGAVNGEGSNWNISTYTEADSFTLSAGETVTGASFAVWVLNNDTVNTVNWAITSIPLGGTTYASGTSTPVSQTFISTDPNYNSNSYGYDIDNESFSIPTLAIASTGTYWLDLSGAVDADSYYVFWDENDNPSVSAFSSHNGGETLTSGTDGCASASCSETFSISGNTPEPATLPLLASGIAGVAILVRRRRLSGSGRIAK